MSDYFKGVTFPWQEVTPSDDAIVRRAILPDRCLSGCELTYSGYTLTMAAGAMIVCGRLFRHTAAQNWAVVDATSGYARLLLTIDVTKASTEYAFEQIYTDIEYASAIDGFPALRQDDINGAGTIYQTVLCVVALNANGITGFARRIIEKGTLTASDVGAFSKDELIPLANGGTNRDLSGIEPYSIIRAASNSAYLLSTPTANGAFYATGANKAATFGTLPIAQGGTGATTAAAALIALGAASATPTVKNMTNSYHRAFLVKIGKLVICVLTSKVLNSTLLYSETLTIDDSNFIPASAKTFYVYSDAGHNEALGSDVSNGGTVNVKISTDGEFKISSDYVHTVGEVCGTYWWITA